MAKLKRERLPKLLRNVFLGKAKIAFKELEIGSITFEHDKKVRRATRAMRLAAFLQRKTKRMVFYKLQHSQARGLELDMIDESI